MSHRLGDSVARARERITWALATIAIMSAIAPAARAAVPERYYVRASIQRDAGLVELEQHVVVRVREAEREIRLWVYGDRLAVAPRALGERTWRWVYPGDIDHGEIQIVYAELEDQVVEPLIDRIEGGVRGRDAAGADLVIAIEPGAARSLDLTLGLRMRVPARFGRMGRDGSTLALAAPWYPLVVEADAWSFVVPHRVRLAIDGGEAWIGGTVVDETAEIERIGPYVPVLLAPHLDLFEGEVEGVPIAWASFEGLYRAPPPRDRSIGALADPLQIDRIALVERELAPVIRTARWLGLPLPPRIDLLMVPSRTELVASAPGVVLVSDRWGQVFPIDAVQQFHLRAMRRALFGRIAQPIAERLDAPGDRGVCEELRAAVLLEVDAVRRTAHGQTPEQLLSAFAFHPAVDQLLYAPQIAFEDVYFEGADAGDAWRDDPIRARVPLPRGRRVLESARDAISDEASFGRFVASVARGRRSIREALERAGAGARWDGWMDAPQLEVNYRLGEIRSERLEGRWRHTIEVIREGAHRVEPVEVELESDRGERVRGVWDGPGARGEVVLETEGARRGVTIDPRHRLPQSPAIADGHPRADDATDQPWRPPIFTGFAFDILASEANVTGLIDVVLRQRYDLEHTFALRLLRTAARTGGRFRYIQGLGPKVHNNRRAMTLGGGVGFYYVQPGFGGSELGGFATDVDLLLSLDTRAYLYDWREGVSLALQAQLTTTARDDGTVGASGRATARGSGTIAIGNLHAIVIVGHVGFTVSPVLDADYQSAGGRYGLRGFANDELLGTSAMYAVAEHRFTAVTDLSWNVFHGVWARELQLAWWLGGGVVLDTFDGREAAGAAEAGLGLRVHYEYAGVQPGVLAIDLGIPYSRWAQSRPCAFGGQAGACDPRTPFGFYVSVDQYY